jgi:hypothetical protein
MGRKLLVSRLGAGSITIAFCAALPGCNLALHPLPTSCFGEPSSRGMSSVECPAVDADPGPDTARDGMGDSPGDATSDTAGKTTDAPAGDSAGDRP